MDHMTFPKLKKFHRNTVKIRLLSGFHGRYRILPDPNELPGYIGKALR